MKLFLKHAVVALSLIGMANIANAKTCNVVPGSTTCGSGTISNLTGNGNVAVHGTTVTGATVVNGLLSAEDASFSSLEVNGSANLVQCTINENVEIKGALKASSTKFQNTLDIYSSTTRFINSKVNSNLHIHHTDDRKQTVYLDNFSEITGDIIFDDGQGEVIVRGNSKIGGKIVGGQLMASK